MTIHHHPSETTLLACAAGTLPEAHVRVLAVHVANCSECASTLAEADIIGGALLDDQPPALLPAESFARVLARLDDPARPDPAPAPLHLADIALGQWSWIAPGISIMKLLPRDESGTRLDLIRVAPGTALLEHGHAALETTCVLQGGFEDGHGAYHTGDMMEGNAGLSHQPKALAGPDCICLMATTGHLRPVSLLGRIICPLIGM